MIWKKRIKGKEKELSSIKKEAIDISDLLKEERAEDENEDIGKLAQTLTPPEIYEYAYQLSNCHRIKQKVLISKIKLFTSCSITWSNDTVEFGIRVLNQGDRLFTIPFELFVEDVGGELLLPIYFQNFR
ncbi:hypothetical protein ACTA71_010076 [Dictyostelium dimigraforme]